MTERVVVVGGGLAGMAAAARLAKARYAVTLFEQSDRLGGRWAARPLLGGVPVDDGPAVLGFPAPWRDLFRKSGRPLEAELSRIGAELVPATPALITFADGSVLDWPADRGGQQAALTHTFGVAVAQRWQDLVDRLDRLWQVLRPLGWEAERPPGKLERQLRRRLLGRLSLAELADALGHPALTALVRSLAYRQGSAPERTPALAAVDLSLARTFGRWQIHSFTGGGRFSVLVELLAARLELRQVDVRLNTPVGELALEHGRVVGLPGEPNATAVLVCADPWTTLTELLPRSTAGRLRRRVRRLRPALAPSVQHHLVDRPTPEVRETVTLSAAGAPMVTYERPHGELTVRSVHDFTAARPRPAYGVAWRGLDSWTDRPSVSGEIPGLLLAGPFSAAGPDPSAEVLSGALAAYAVKGAD
jgi:phytoene dehydrogenase-like protein